MNKSDFWNNVYKSKDIDAVSWYADRLDTSLELIEKNCSRIALKDFLISLMLSIE